MRKIKVGLHLCTTHVSMDITTAQSFWCQVELMFIHHPSQRLLFTMLLSMEMLNVFACSWAKERTQMLETKKDQHQHTNLRSMAILNAFEFSLTAYSYWLLINNQSLLDPSGVQCRYFGSRWRRFSSFTPSCVLRQVGMRCITARSWFVSSNHKTSLLFIHYLGADVEIQDNEEGTALHNACFNGHTKVWDRFDRTRKLESKCHRTSAWSYFWLRKQISTVLIRVEPRLSISLSWMDTKVCYSYKAIVPWSYLYKRMRCIVGWPWVVAWKRWRWRSISSSSSNCSPRLCGLLVGEGDFEDSAFFLFFCITNYFLKGAEIDPRDSRGRTPLFVAVENGCEQTARLLIEKGADIETQVRFSLVTNTNS